MEVGPLVDSALDHDAPVHTLGIACYGEQPHAAAENLGIDGVAPTEELPEELALLSGTDAYTVVHYMESPVRSVAVEAEHYRVAILAVFDGIGSKVDDDPAAVR